MKESNPTSMSKKVYRKLNFYLYLSENKKTKEEEQKYNPTS